MKPSGGRQRSDHELDMCVTLAVCVVVDEFFAVYFVPLAVGGCVGYLLKGWRGLCTGVFVAIFATLLIGMPVYVLWIWRGAS